jgi:membrane associated rhomboid family serine protease/Zn-finger nucleic acid-binding protein
VFACPNCTQALQPQRGPRGVLWICPVCKGRAAGLGVLRKIFGPKRVATIWSESCRDPVESGCACPVCRGATAQVTWLEQDRPLTVDLCRRCEFAWFGPGEYESISLAPAPPHRLGDVDMRSLPLDAREQIAMEKVREIAREADANGDPPELTWQTAPAFLGLPVELDTAGSARAPVATYVLAALIAVVSLFEFLARYRGHYNMVAAFGLIPAKAGRDFDLTFLTSFFLHANLWHLVTNLYFLVIFGRHVESYLGPWRWLVVTAVSAVAGGLLDVACRSHSMIPLIGASGGISGLLAFYACKFPHARLGMMLFVRFYYRWITLPAWGAFALWILIQFWGAFLELKEMGNVASLAHLGGVAAGIFFWFVWDDLDTKSAASSIYPRIQIRS